MDRERKGATRGKGLSRRWRCGGGEAAARGAALPAAGEQSRDPRARGGRREGTHKGEVSTTCARKMLHIKVVEFFKLYNIALGLGFRKSKFTTL
jgi:hypothetical protein